MAKIVLIKAWKNGRVPVGRVIEQTKEKAEEMVKDGFAKMYDGPLADGENVKPFNPSEEEE